MITGQHAVIRAADPDDAPAMVRLHQPDKPRAFLLDMRRELQNPSIDEVREILGRKEIRQYPFYLIEDLTGLARGMWTLRAPAPDVFFSEFLLALYDDADYAGPLGLEVMAFIRHYALVEKGLRKVVCQCLCCEDAYRACLIAAGFTSCGVMRQITYTGGRYLDLETFSLTRDEYAALSGAQGEVSCP